MGFFHKGCLRMFIYNENLKSGYIYSFNSVI